MLFPEPRHAFDAGLQLLAQRLNGLLDTLMLRLGQFLEVLVAENLAILDRRQYVAGRRLHQRNALGARSLAQRFP